MRLLRMCLVLAVVAYGLVLAFSLGSFGTSSGSAYEYNTGHLIVTKHVVNDNGGSAVASDFTMTIGGVVASGGNSFPGSESGTDKVVTTGSYSVSETGPAGYNSSFSSGCSGTIAAGQTVNCTFTNDDTAGVHSIRATGSGNVGDVSFDLSFRNSGGQLSGTCAVNEVQPRTRIKCLDVTSLTATQLTDGERAVVQGHATINGVATTYTMTVEDHGSPGVGHDSFTIDTATGYHRSGTLSGGNITVTLS
jgi:hypothetical protein